MNPITPLRTAMLIAMLAALPVAAQTGNPGGRINDRLGEMDYGVCRGIDPACYHDWARKTPAEYRVLLFTRTPGPRHANLGPPLAAGLNPPLAEGNIVQREMVALLAKQQIKVDYTEDLAEMQAPRLNNYNAVIFLSTTRDTLDDGAKTALRQYIRAGGGFVGIHNAFGTSTTGPATKACSAAPTTTTTAARRQRRDDRQERRLDHGPAGALGLRGRVVQLRALPDPCALPRHGRRELVGAGRKRLPQRRRRTARRRGAAAPLKAWAPRGRPALAAAAGAGPPSVVGEHPGHGGFHPVAWCQYYDGGKVWVTTLGHDSHLFDADGSKLPGALEFQKFIVAGIRSAMGLEPFCR